MDVEMGMGADVCIEKAGIWEFFRLTNECCTNQVSSRVVNAYRQALCLLLGDYNVGLCWVQGHYNNVGNGVADELPGMYIEEAVRSFKPISATSTDCRRITFQKEHTRNVILWWVAMYQRY